MNYEEDREEYTHSKTPNHSFSKESHEPPHSIQTNISQGRDKEGAQKCDICCYDYEQLYALTDCRHQRFCIDCLKEFVASALQSHTAFVKCPTDGCPQHLDSTSPFFNFHLSRKEQNGVTRLHNHLLSLKNPKLFRPCAQDNCFGKLFIRQPQGNQEKALLPPPLSKVDRHPMERKIIENLHLQNAEKNNKPILSNPEKIPSVRVPPKENPEPVLPISPSDKLEKEKMKEQSVAGKEPSSQRIGEGPPLPKGREGKEIQLLVCEVCQANHCPDCFLLSHSGQCDRTVALSLESNKKFRRCSQCGQVIEKSEGCTHMTCTCGHYFCYSCGKTLEGAHECVTPTELVCFNGIRWQIEHIELFYEGSALNFLRCLVCLQPADKTPLVLKALYFLFYSLFVYPFTILLGVVGVCLFFGALVSILAIFTVVLPVVAACNTGSMRMCPTESMVRGCGVVPAVVVILLLYPVFYVVDVVQLVGMFVCGEERNNMREIFRLVEEVFLGLRNVLVMPCVMLVDNKEFYEKENEAAKSLPPSKDNGIQDEMLPE